MIIRGNSGASVQLVDGAVIRKTAVGAIRMRLKRQIEKQDAFHRARQSGCIRTPAILRTAETPDAYTADMEFVVAQDFAQFLTEEPAPRIRWFTATIREFVAANVATSQCVDVRSEVRSKINDLAKQQNVPPECVALARSLSDGPVAVPRGPCHGDLTLSNMLFRRDGIVLIDFLDPFIESPLQDMVKLRQDTRHYWSLSMYPAYCDQVKVKLALAYVDRCLDAVFMEYPWYRRHYLLFQVVNFMRILPYCTEAGTTRTALGALERLAEESVREKLFVFPNGAYDAVSAVLRRA